MNFQKKKKKFLLTLLSGARSMAKCPSTSLLSVSAPALSNSNAASPWPSEIAKQT